MRLIGIQPILNWLITSVFIAILGGPAQAENMHTPDEVKNYIENRNRCDHFRGEPVEGNSPEQIERRKFVIDSLGIYCSGTDKQLAALKRRYRSDHAVMSELNNFEEKIESR